jgi:flagellin-like hook-associated protein FlgL
LNDDTTPTNGSADVVYRGDGTSVTTAGWDAVYDAVARQWTIRNLTTATVEGTLSASPLSGGTIDFEGPNGFRLTIDAPAGGAYNTGDRFIWSNQEHVPPVVRTGHYAPAGLPGSGAAVTREGDGYDVSASSWRATYDAEDREWTVRNTTTGQTVGTLSAAPDAGGTLSNIEGADGFALTISAPTSGTYSTGDYFTWQNEEHIQAFPGIAEYTDIDQESVSLQVGPDSNQVFREEPIVLEADYYKIIGSYVTYRYGSVNMTLLGSTPTAVTWASLICPQELSVSAQAQAQAAVDKLNIGIDHLSALSATVGAELNRMEQTLSGLRNYEENIRSTESRIRDVDIAWETTKFAKYQLLAQFSTSILAQANAISAGVLELLR